MTRKYFAAALVAASALASGSALARPPVVVTANTDLPTRQVSYADLNLANVAGQKSLEARIRGAAFTVCADSGWTNGSREESQGFSKCRGDAIDGARPAMSAAIERARELASTGHSAIASSATITLSAQH